VRPQRPDPIQALAVEPWRWDFFQALRAIDAFHADKPRLGTARRPGDEAVRMGQAADMSFAPSSLASVKLDGPGGLPRIDVRFFGLFGPNGPLPLHLTAYARERQLHKGDETLVRFADMFHHRLLLLFYRAWAQAQPTASLDRPQEDRWADFVGSLVGIGGAEWRGRDAAPVHAKLFFAGLLSSQVRNADGLQALVAGYLRVPVRLEPFVGRWMRLLREERTRIGRRGARRRTATAQLGTSAVLGGAVFDRQHHFRLHLGPLDAEQFESLLPTGTALPAMKALVDHYLGHEFGWDLRLELRPEARPDCRLGRQGRLGWTTWLGAPRGGGAPQLILNPETPQASH
jgi:type VI secretion system protein ImpH